MTNPVDLKRRKLIKMSGVVAVLPVAGCGGEMDSKDSVDSASPSLKANAFASAPGSATQVAAIRSASAGSPILPPEQSLLFRYDKPALESNILYEGLPIGNGRLGALVGGASNREALYLNEITLWSGDRNVVDLSYSADEMGSYQTLGKLYVDLPEHAQASAYTRTLDISNSIVRTQYSVGESIYNREVFCSFPDNVVVARFTSSEGMYTGAVSMVDGQGRPTVGEAAGAMSFSGWIPGSGEVYATYVQVLADSGTVAFDSANRRITMTNCPAFTIALAAGTDYDGIYADGYLTGVNPLNKARADVTAAAAKAYQDLLWNHVADYRRLFSRVELNLGTSTAAQNALTIPARLQAREKNSAVADPELEAMYVQFGRYLTISSSRGPVPMNLQGLWNVSNNPPWYADYHTDINVQMAYWLTNLAALPECQSAFSDFVVKQWPAWVDVTKNHFNDSANSNYRNSNGKIAGWTLAVSTSIYGTTGWDWSPPASAWYCRTLWNHYQYTLDSTYLATIYPVMKSACEFWEARLIKDPKSGLLVDDNDWSPEHGSHQRKGITFAQELVWDLFTNYVSATQVLGKDSDYASTISNLKAQLYLPAISPTTGQLQEWMEDVVDSGDPQHRHLSPLIGWFEGERIDLNSDPALVVAVKKLLVARGTESYGWGLAWRMVCWAHFNDAATCYSMLPKLLRLSNGQDSVNGSFSNMLDSYSFGGGSPNAFQIDANMGGAASVLQMLLQSWMTRIVFLPALPSQWSTGGVKGLRAKGGFSVDITWSDGALVSATIWSLGGTQTTLQYGTVTRDVSIPLNGHLVVNKGLQPA